MRNKSLFPHTRIHLANHRAATAASARADAMRPAHLKSKVRIDIRNKRVKVTLNASKRAARCIHTSKRRLRTEGREAAGAPT